MGTITGLTAERMIEMENATVIDGDIVGDNLVLKTRDGTSIDAGSVRGPVGPPGINGSGFVICTSDTRPVLAPADEGKAIYETDTDLVWFWDGDSWIAPPGGIPLAGCVSFYGPLEPPGGMWKFPNGQLLNRVTYDQLFALIGTTYGVGDGSSTFALPDVRDRFQLMTVDGSDLNKKGGAKTVALSVANLAAHAHTMAAAGVHNHNPSGYQFAVGELPTSTIWANTGAAGGHAGDLTFTATTDNSPAHTHAINNAGSGTAHENMPPYITVNQLMRVR
jgi:microcystin-dependent protein